MHLQGNLAHRVISCPSSFVRVQNSMCQFTFCGKFQNLISKINYFWQQLVFSFTILLFENQLTMSTQNFAPFHYRFIIYSAKFLVPAKLSPEPSSTLWKKKKTRWLGWLSLVLCSKPAARPCLLDWRLHGSQFCSCNSWHFFDDQYELLSLVWRIKFWTPTSDGCKWKPEANGENNKIFHQTRKQSTLRSSGTYVHTTFTIGDLHGSDASTGSCWCNKTWGCFWKLYSVGWTWPRS